MSFGYNPYGRGRGRGSRRGGSSFSSVSPSGRQNPVNPMQTNDNMVNTWQGQYVGDVCQQYSQLNSGYSANEYSNHDNIIKHGEVHGSWPAVGAEAWQALQNQGDVAGNQLQNTATDIAKTQHQWQCSLCNIDFTDRKRYELHCAGIVHKQKVHEKEPQLMEEGLPDRIAETRGSPWPSRETGGSSWPSRETGGSSWSSREPYIAQLSSDGDRMAWNEQPPLSRTTQTAERPKKLEQQGRASSQSEQNVGFLKPILKKSPAKATLAQSNTTSQFPGANRSAPTYTVAGGRRPEEIAKGDAAEQYGYNTRGSWNSPFDDTRQHQDTSGDCGSTEQFQQRNDEELFSSGRNSQFSGVQGNHTAWNTGGGIYPDGNAQQRTDSEEWRNQDSSSFGKQQFLGSAVQSRENKRGLYGNKCSVDGMYDQEESIPGLEMLPDHQSDMDGQSEWFSQESLQSGFSSNLWEKEDNSNQKGGGLQRGMPFRDWEHHETERGHQPGSYEQRGMIRNRSENQYKRGLQSSQKMSESTDTLLRQGRQSDSYESVPEQSLQSDNYRQYGMVPEATDPQHGKPQYEQQGMKPKPVERQPERSQQSSLYDKLQTMSKPVDGQQGRFPSDNVGQPGRVSTPMEGLQGRGIPLGNWQGQELTQRHVEGQRDPGMSFGDSKQQGLMQRQMEAQHGPGMPFGDRQQHVEESWIPKSTGSFTDSWQQEHRSEPWPRPQDARGAIGQRQEILPLMQIDRDLRRPDIGRDFSQPDGCRNLNRPDGVRDFRQPDGNRDFSQPDSIRVFGQPDRVRDFRQPDGGRDLSRPDGSRVLSRADGGKDFRQPDGGRDFRQPDGGRDFSQPDGGRDFRQTDGGRDFRQPDGGRDFRQADRGRDFRQPDGGRDFRQPDRGRDFRQPDGGRNLSRPDGGRDLSQPSRFHQQQSAVFAAQTPGTQQDHLWSKQEPKSINRPTSTPQTQPGNLQKPAPGPEEKGKIVCALCDIQLSESNKMTHEATIKHCAKYLYKQIVLGCKDFGSQFSNAVFGLTDAYSVAPQAQKPVKLLIYRCGLVMKYECGACSLKCFGQNQWYTHIRSPKHFKRCQNVISQKGLEGFLDMYGVLPLVQPEEDDSPTKKPGTQSETLTQVQGQEARSSYSKDKITTKKYEVTYPVSGATVSESMPKLTVYEYSHTSSTNAPPPPKQDLHVVRRPRPRILDPSGVKHHVDTVIDPSGVLDPSSVRHPVDPNVMGRPVSGVLDPSGMLDVRHPVGGTLDPSTLGRPVSTSVDVTAPEDSKRKPTVFEYSHTSRVVTPQPSVSMGVLDEQSIKKIADTISDIKNASKQQDNTPTHPEHTVKGIFPIVDYYPATVHRSSVPNYGTDASRQTYPLERKDDGQRIETLDTDRSRERRQKEERGFSERTRAPVGGRMNFGLAEQRSRYGRSSEIGADSKRQPRDVDRRGQEHHGDARSHEQRSQEQRRSRGDETSKHRDAHRSTSRASGTSEGSRTSQSDNRTKSQSDNRTKSGTPQKQAAKPASSHELRPKATKPLVQTMTRTAATKKAEEQVQGKSSASKLSVTKQLQVGKDQGKLTTEKPSVKKDTSEKTKHGEQASGKPVVAKTAVKQETKRGEQPGSKPLVAKTEVKQVAKTQRTGEKVPSQPATKTKTDRKPDIKKPEKDAVATEKQTDNGVKKEPATQIKTKQKGTSVKDKFSKVADDKKASQSLKKPEIVIDLTGPDNREKLSARRGEKSEVSSRSNKSDSERSFSQSRERMSESHNRERKSGREHARPQWLNDGRRRPVYDQELRSSSRDRGSQHEGYRGSRHDPQSDRSRHDPHTEHATHDPHTEHATHDPQTEHARHNQEHARHDPHAEHARHDAHAERARHDPYAERNRHDPHAERARHDPLAGRDRHDPRPECARHDPHAEMHDWLARDEDRDWERQRGYADRHSEDEYNEDEGLQNWLDEEHWLDRFGEEEEEENYEEHTFMEVAEPVQEPPAFRGRGRGWGRGKTWNRGGRRQYNATSHEPNRTRRRHSDVSRGADEHVGHSRQDIRPEHQMTRRDNPPEELMDMDTAVAVFTQTLQQFVNSLQGQTTSDCHMGGRVARLTPEEHQFVEQIEAMTGIHDAGTILSAIDILQNMDSKVIQTLGSLDPSVIQELFTGNLSLQGCGGMDMQQMVQSMLWSGAQGQAEERQTVEIAQRREVGQRGRGRWIGRGRFQRRRGMVQKRSVHDGRGRGGPPAKRGRAFP